MKAPKDLTEGAHFDPIQLPQTLSPVCLSPIKMTKDALEPQRDVGLGPGIHLKSGGHLAEDLMLRSLLQKFGDAVGSKPP